MAEELGLTVSEADLVLFRECKHLPGTEFQAIFVVRRDLDTNSVDLEEDEVQRVDWRSFSDLEQLLVAERNKNWTQVGYEQELLAWLKNTFEEVAGSSYKG